MKEKISYIIKLLFCFFSFYFLSDLIKYIIKILDFDVNAFSNFTKILLQLITSLIIFVLLFIVYNKDIKKEFNDIKKKVSVGYILKMFLFFIVFKYLVGVVAVILLEYMGLDANNLTSVNQSTIEAYAKSSPILIFITSVILAPVYEELLFRLGIKKVFNNKYIFVIMSGCIFGLLHIFPLSKGISLELGLVQSLGYVTMGMFLAYVYEKTNNIFNSIGLHFLNNLISILILINGL